MIVGPLFPTDADHALRQAQQRDIHRAVGVMLSEARSRWQDAEALLDTRPALGAAIRTMEPKLDLIDDGAEYLAGYWRLVTDRVHPRLALDDGDAAEGAMADWLIWLRQWMRQSCPPGLMRAFLSCAYEPDDRALPNHGYMIQWLRDFLTVEFNRRKADA